ncbi:MAG TPA: hypothetical protein VJZ71_00615 [Phycisphaerae bacterium]|nr:hypothetical protein [Phycisphaerae bacterium]
MGVRFRYRAAALCAAAFVAVVSTVRAEPARNCPALADQFIIISKTQPTAFRLNVFNLGDSTISIFQFPLGGILQQPGPTPLDFVFVPMPDFGGTTTFAYRLIPPPGCSVDFPVGYVTLAGGTADGTDAGLNDPPVEELCGEGFPLFFPFALLGFFVAPRRRKM